MVVGGGGPGGVAVAAIAIANVRAIFLSAREIVRPSSRFSFLPRPPFSWPLHGPVKPHRHLKHALKGRNQQKLALWTRPSKQ